MFDIRRIRMIGFYAINSDQWHAYITHFFEQSVQGGLISHRAAQERVAVFVPRDGHSFKPFSPPIIQVSLEVNFIA